jgi:hypothetical protein
MHVQGPWRQPRLAFDFGAASGGSLAQAPETAGDAALTLVRAVTPVAGEHTSAAARSK